jgi:hypothetical protein
LDEDVAVRVRIAAALGTFFESFDQSDEDSGADPPPGGTDIPPCPFD